MGRLMSPFTRTGGKRRTASEIILHFPNNYPDYTYVAPFLGAGWIFLTMRRPRYALLNDLDRVLYNAWVCVRNHSEKLCDWLSLEIKHSLLMDDYFRKLQAPIDVPDVEKAGMFIILSKMARYARLQPENPPVSRFGIMSMSIDLLRQAVSDCAKILDVAWIHCMDAEDFVERVLSLEATRNTRLLFYLDPTYPETDNHYYDLSTGERLVCEWERVEKICNRIDNAGELFYLSINSTNQTEELASRFLRIKIRSLERTKIGTEMLVTNYEDVHKQSPLETFLEEEKPGVGK